MVDILQVLEGATYVAFVAGAVFAILELRSMGKDREADFLMRLNEFTSSREFEETRVKLMDLPHTDDARKIEAEVGKVALLSYVDYWEGVAALVAIKSLKLSVALGLADWFGLWEKLDSWVIDMRQKGSSMFAEGFEWFVEEEQRYLARMESRADRSS